MERDMSKILLKNISIVATMDDERKILKNTDILINENRIEKIAKNTKEKAQILISGQGKVALPGFINTHHHFYQTMTRVLKKVTDAKLFDWLLYLYDIWANLTPEWVEISTKIAVGELLLSGCTTTLDHYYVYPDNKNNFLDIESVRYKVSSHTGGNVS